MAVATVPEPIRLPLPGGSASATVRVRPLRCGEVLFPPTAIDRPRGPLSQLRAAGLTTPRSRRTWVPVPVFLVEHPTAGRLLIDTGLDASVEKSPHTSLGRRQGWVFPARLGPEESAPARLRALGIEPEDIGVIVMTHLHNDHASGIAQFPHARFVVDAVEWREACAGGFTRGYRHAQFDHPFDWRTVDYAAPGVGGHATFERSLDLFGDGSVRLLSTRGHTLGHQSILLALDGREMLLTADAAYTHRTVDDDLLPLMFSDKRLYLRSLAAIREYARRAPAAVVVCGHDAGHWSQLEPLYA